MLTGSKRSITNVHAEVPTLIAPKIEKRFIQDGRVMYQGIDGKHYIATLYDKMFKTTRGKLLGRYAKGDNPNYLLQITAGHKVVKS